MRLKIIDEVISDLDSLRGKIATDKIYALEENIKFFNSIRSFAGYLKWLFNDMRKIEPERLLELSDFGIGRWERLLQRELLLLEQNKKIDMLRQIREQLISSIEGLVKEEKDKPVIVMSIGAGNLEIERQVVDVLNARDLGRKVVFLALDSSEDSLAAGLENIDPTGVKKFSMKSLPEDLDTLTSSIDLGPCNLAYYVGNALDLGKFLPKKSIDIIYYSKLRHHIPVGERDGFDKITTSLSDRVIEWDDYHGFYLPFFSTLMAWNKPVLLNGAIFSFIRDPKKDDLKKEGRPGWKTTIFPGSGYLSIYNEG